MLTERQAAKLNAAHWAKVKAERAARNAKAEVVAALENAKHRQVGILTLDIESTPLEAFVWGLFDQNIGVDFIKTEWSILSYSAKWLGKKKIYYNDTGGRGRKKVRDDKKLCGEIRTLLDDADIVVAQNGKRFDVRKVNARLIVHGYAPPRPFRVIDTLVEGRKHFAFTSQKLAWTSQHLTNVPKDDHRKFPGIELWKACLLDNPKVWPELKKYNERDVIATEQVYLRMRPWISGHPNLGMYDAREQPVCPKCGSTNLQAEGRKVLQQTEYPQLRCVDCGGWSRGKELLSPKNIRRTRLVPL